MHFIEVMAKIFIYPLTFNSEGNSWPINPTRFHNLEEEIEMGPHLCYNVMENRITNSVFFVKSNTKQINIFYFVSEAPKFKNLFFLVLVFSVSKLFLRTLLKSSDFNGFNHIFWQIQWFTSLMRYNNLLFRFPDFSGFSSNLLISRLNWRNLKRLLQFWPYLFTKLIV